MASKKKQYYKALISASIVSKTDKDGIIIYANENFCNITGYTQEEMLGKTHAMFRHPSNPDSIYKEMWDTIRCGRIWRDRMTNLNKDGSEFIAESTIIPLLDDDGEVLEYLAIRNDVTDMVRLRRAVFIQEQEKLKEKKIQEAQNAFLLLFTHELKTPLNAIINFSKYIKKQIISPKEQDTDKLVGLIDTVSSNAADMLESVTTILETSKLHSDTLTYHYKHFSPAVVINRVIARYASLVSDREIELEAVLDEGVLIYSDEHRFSQIFANIYSNAIKYGNDKITVVLSAKDGTMELSVTDNGCGIKDKEKVFKLYAQEDTSFLERSSQGTGIGLYFLQLLCRDLRIEYKVEDADANCGTKFSIFVKL